MKLSKLGFTMAELLLCIAIIGIVSAMGMTITKKGTEKAYNLYYYTGYVNMYNAIADAVATGEDNYVLGAGTPALVKHVAKSFDIEEDEIVANGNGGTLNLPNGIRYFFTNYEDNYVRIIMQVPTLKTGQNNGISAPVELYYIRDIQQLVPSFQMGIPIQDRRDLLPAYIDDGKVGRNNVMNRSSWQYQRPVYGSYKDAFCSIYGAGKVIAGIINCSTGFTNISAGRTGVIKIADPRKAR